MEIPESWRQIRPETLGGTVMVVGAPDMGKSTLARYLFGEVVRAGRRAAFLDGDPGQSMLGPPTALTVALGSPREDAFPPRGTSWRRFVGDVTPRSHMLQVVIGAQRLAEQARQAGADVVVYDTSGLVAVNQGGLNLKLAKIDLLRPTTVCAIQRARELEPLLRVLRRMAQVRLVELRPSRAVEPRGMEERRAYRSRRFAAYFAGARSLTVAWHQLAVRPAPEFRVQRLVALEDASGFMLGLGVVLGVDAAARVVTLLTPLASLEGVATLHLGDITLDPERFGDA